MQKTTFHSRASGKTQHGAWAYPRGFPRLQLQLFTRRLDHALTQRAIGRIASEYTASEREWVDAPAVGREIL